MSTIRLGRPRSALLPTLVIAAVVVILFAIFTNVWTDRLWYVSFDFGAVFNTMLVTRLGLFASFGLLMAAVVAANAAVAYRLRPRVRGAGPSSPLLERYREVLEQRLVWVIIGLGVVVGVFAGATASGQVFTYLAWRNSTPFGVTDPVFNLDIGFFVFDYPWWRFALSFVFVALLFSAAAAAIIHYLMGGLRLIGPGRGGTPGAQAHLSILVGLAVLVRGVGYWFDQYGLNIADTSIMTGMNYTADNATRNADVILAIIAGLCAVLFFANAVLRRWSVPIIGLTLMILSAIILGVVYPAGVQLLQVRANEPVRERPYIERNIAATRSAYDVADVEIADYSARTTASAGQLRADAEALPGIRLIDPAVVGPAYEQLQQVRGYYAFGDVLDVDRYTIDGAETDAVVAVREMNHQGIEAQNWNNLKRVYTHGYGLVAAYGNRRQPGGEPEWIVKDIPPTGKLTEYEPRIYFGEKQTDYSIVGAPEGAPSVEFDTPSGGEGGNPATNTYEGKGGVPVGDLWSRLLYAAKFADVNMLLSTELNPESKIIYDRTPRERVMKAAPWLRVDADMYPAVVDGRIVWIADGYTTSNSYPYSQRVSLEEATSDSRTRVGALPAQPDSMINYMRNSVKATVDAYDGTVTLYTWDDTDPVLQTWKKVFPGIVKDKAEISADLLKHLRYPQDMYKVQREILARYHITDPQNWYQNSDLWRVSDDPRQGAPAGSKESPNFLSIKWPGDESAVFSLTSTYVPEGRQNLAAYMAVNADASSPNYGQLRILRMSAQTQIDGPGQTANVFNSNEVVAERLRPFQQGTATAQFGNLLTLPIGGGLLYAQPIYTQRQGSTAAYPVLRFVLVRFGGSVAIGDTLQQALDQVFKGNAGAKTDEEGGTEPPDNGGENPDNPAASQALAEAGQAFEEADQALKSGDLATYQAKIKEAEEAIKRAQAALNR
ncbi:UPF0182 family protein [Microlunatus speluncae]|uniref:UPF0182 family membrane protein n=1 Tax=Microlunatus speluncae TaxID=2594267 RepID=UPI0012663267|nr:UPF0182 family protein [Microlunatus speluncae]